MADQELHVVTGAFGYSGRCIAERLLDAGHSVRTLTNSPHRANPFGGPCSRGNLSLQGGRVEARAFSFDDPACLVEALRGARVLYNTYWVRFNTREFTFAQAVRNSRTLFAAAEEAGVGRVVHVSITNPSEDSPLEYFRGKAQVERALVQSGLPHTILRPAVLFGREDILVNNIAWALRRMPVFTVFGDGLYRLQPIHVDDLAALAVQEGRADGSRTIDAIGPETFTYRGLVETIGRAIGKVRPILSVLPTVGWLGAWFVGKVMGDVMLTRDEVRGLMAGLLATDSPPAGLTRLSDWAREHADTLGMHYASELARRRNRGKAYDHL